MMRGPEKAHGRDDFWDRIERMKGSCEQTLENRVLVAEQWTAWQICATQRRQVWLEKEDVQQEGPDYPEEGANS